ncbi:MAG: ABC transporter ATP-binding protein [Lachnospiraceae bacterium]|nr:ABC transporter ATP-binding protein [Lachnospiraceae bacterium]
MKKTENKKTTEEITETEKAEATETTEKAETNKNTEEAGKPGDAEKQEEAGKPGEAREPLIRFENVGKIYHTGQIVYEALHDVNLEVMEGELVVILGPSGAGKSTLLNLLGGLDGATSGKIFFGGEDITSFDDRRLGKFRAVDVGIVFQFYNLVPTLTAYENVDLMHDLGVEIMDPIKALEMVGLADRKDNFPSQMSGGQQQRISIARAIAKMPRLLLCDEPTGALDTNTGKEVLKILQDQSRVHKKTVVMVTHNSLFADIADKVVLVKNGTVVDVQINEAPQDAEDLNW